ncbi:MAG: superoxide dismutase family protein [Chloroflexota bacterium]|nr:superoxide dismutase family protein [Chloroflexota bacterium]
MSEIRRSKWVIIGLVLVLLIVLGALRLAVAHAQGDSVILESPDGEMVGTALITSVDDAVEIEMEVDEVDLEDPNLRIVLTNRGECRAAARVRPRIILARLRTTAFSPTEDEAGVRLVTEAVTFDELATDSGSALYLVDTEAREVVACGVLFPAEQVTAREEDEVPTRATADIVNTEGETVGEATFTHTEEGAVQVQVELSDFDDATDGEHGIHIHETGTCETPDFESAGEHFNPTDASHGFLDPQGPHVGDLPNIRFSDGSADYQTTTHRITLQTGERSLFDEDGSAIVIHAQPDDYLTDPGGDSGDRIACGVIEAATEEVEATPTPTAAVQDVAVADIVDDPEQFIRQTVRVRGTVSEPISLRAFRLSEDDEEIAILTMRPLVRAVEQDEALRVMGTVREFERDEIEEELGVELEDELAEALEGEPVILATSARTAPAAPAATPEVEEAEDEG